MALSEGRHQVGPQAGRLLVRTSRTGLGRRAGHDLTIEATRWSGTADVAEPADPSGASVSVEVEAGSLEVREGTGGVKPLTDADRAEIKDNIRTKVLHTDRHPTIEFRSTRVTGSAERPTIEGELTIMGRSRPATVRCERDGDRLRGAATIKQSDWGIKPYSAFFGALKLADEVEIAVDVTL